MSARDNRAQRGLVIVMVMAFISALGVLLAAVLPAMLAERRASDRDYLRLVAAEMLSSGFEMARPLRPPSSEQTWREEAVSDAGALAKGGFTLTLRPHEGGLRAEVTAEVRSELFGRRCTQRAVGLLRPDAEDGGALALRALQTGEFACEPAP